MRITMTMKWDGVTPNQYDGMRKTLKMDETAPRGLVFHVAGFKDNAIRITDVWESEDDFNSYTHSYLMPAAIEHKLEGAPQIEIFPVYAMLAPALSM
jgi:hypothetical protein